MGKRWLPVISGGGEHIKKPVKLWKYKYIYTGVNNVFNFDFHCLFPFVKKKDCDQNRAHESFRATWARWYCWDWKLWILINWCPWIIKPQFFFRRYSLAIIVGIEFRVFLIFIQKLWYKWRTVWKRKPETVKTFRFLFTRWYTCKANCSQLSKKLEIRHYCRHCKWLALCTNNRELKKFICKYNK